MSEDKLKVGLAQISPVWLDKQGTLTKVCDWIEKAANQGCELVAFGEGLVPGYPHWLSLTKGSEFESDMQKTLHAYYMHNAVRISRGDLDEVCALAAKNSIAIYLGTIELAEDRGGHSLYCSLVYINPNGKIKSAHRKLQPTYEERLTWSVGDGHGLRTHDLKGFCVGGLNCWENWMPLTRTALYGMGENVHVAVWPGSEVNTKDITRFIARESRSYTLSVSSILSVKDIRSDIPYCKEIAANAPKWLANGGSCIAGPDGEWIVEPVTEKEELVVAELDLTKVFEERQNFDPTGHYSRPDVLKLKINRQRQQIVNFKGE